MPGRLLHSRIRMPENVFEMKERDGLARICELELHGKKMETPALLPVINPKMPSIAPRRLQEEFGFSGIITNSFIISRDADIKERVLRDGIHRYLDFDGIIMTDSGTFQEHVYGELQIDPLEIVTFQRDIGADIGTILDVFSEPGFNREKAEAAVRTTVERAKLSVPERGEMWLSGPIQGSLFPDLRTMCAREMSSLDIQVHPIGGVVPLMEGYRFPELVDVIVASKKGLDPSRPVHLFGAGHPMTFPLAALLGCDMFDSASYAKYARDGRLMFAEGTTDLKSLEGHWCQCPVCSKHTPKELRSYEATVRERLIAEHNLFECQSMIRRIKQAIREGAIWELAEKICRSHPKLLEGLRSLRKHLDYLERFEPLSREGALMFTGEESYHRPAIYRYQKRFFERYRHPDIDVMIALPEAGKPYSRTYAHVLEKTGAHLMVLSPIGPVPIELDEIYPVSHFFVPGQAEEAERRENIELLERFSHEQRYSLTALYEGDETIDFVNSMRTRKDRFDIDRARVLGVLSMQFGQNASAALANSKLEYVRSKTNNRIRNVMVDGEHAFSIRATDGFFSLTDAGAKLLHKALPFPRYRVIIDPDSVPFIQKGSNVFAKFVLDADDEIRPGDSVLIVTKDDELVGHGRALMTRDEMIAFKRGMAVRTRRRSGGENSEGDD
ncbi:MAG: tRNA guanosine(15) transglycosylase TgtA [Thermoplasmata archaeon]